MQGAPAPCYNPPMLYLFLSDLLFFFVFSGTGFLASSFTFLKLRGNNFFLNFFLGFSLSAIYFSFINFFLPLTAWTLLPVLAAGMWGTALYVRRVSASGRGLAGFLSGHRWHILACAVLLFKVCYQCSKAEGVSAVDTLLYHASSLSWMNAYKIIPGLANVFPNLASNSLYLHLAAGLDVGPWDKQMSSVLYSLFYFAFMLYAASDILGAATGKGKNALPVALFQSVMIIWFFVNNTLDDPSLYYDKPTLAFIAICLTEMLFYKSEGPSRSSPEAVFFFASVAFGIKLLGAVAVVFCFAFCMHHLLKNKALSVPRLIRLCALPLCIFIAFVIRNLIQVGYPFFQSPAFRADLPWTIPHELAVTTYDIIHYGSRWSPVPVAADMWKIPFLQWFIPWCGRALYPEHIQFLFVSVLSLALLVRSLVRRQTESLFYYALILVNITYWFISAPLFRFGNGFFYDLLALGLFFNADMLAAPLKKCRNLARKALPQGRRLAGFLGKEKTRLFIVFFLLALVLVLSIPAVQDFLITLGSRLKGKELSVTHWKKEIYKAVRCSAIVAIALALLPLAGKISGKTEKRPFVLACYAVIVFFACEIAIKNRNLIMTIPVMPAPTERRLVCEEQDFYINLSVEPIVCGDAELPCAPRGWYTDKLRLFDKDDMGKGFYTIQ